MQPLGRKPKRFPGKKDEHPGRGCINWWEDEMRTENKKRNRQTAKSEIRKFLNGNPSYQMKDHLDEKTLEQFEDEALGRGAWMRGVAGSVCFVIGDFKDEEICALCGALSSVLCDAPLGESRTCNMPLCEACCKTIGNDLHVCPIHFNQEGYSKAVFINNPLEEGRADTYLNNQNLRKPFE